MEAAMIQRTGAQLPVAMPGALPADRNPALVYLASLAAGSRPTMRQALDVIARTLTGGAVDAPGLSWSALRYQHTQAIRTALAERYAPATANRMLSALRSVLREAWRLGLMPAEDFHRAADLKPVTGSTLPAGRGLSPGEIRALFLACADGTPAGARDAALMGLLYAGGLRRAEAVALELEDLDGKTGALAIRSGKGRKARIVYAKNGAREALEAWLAIRGEAPGALLCPVKKGGAVDLRPMTGQAVLYVLRRRAAQASVARFSPHDFRRSFISDLLDGGADLVTVQHLAGHASPTTTARYDRRGERAKQRAVDLLHVPYIAAAAR